MAARPLSQAVWLLATLLHTSSLQEPQHKGWWGPCDLGRKEDRTVRKGKTSLGSRAVSPRAYLLVITILATSALHLFEVQHFMAGMAKGSVGSLNHVPLPQQSHSERLQLESRHRALGSAKHLPPSRSPRLAPSHTAAFTDISERVFD